MSSYRDVPATAARVGIAGAAERVTLACRALSAAANDLRVAYEQDGVAAVADAADPDSPVPGRDAARSASERGVRSIQVARHE